MNRAEPGFASRERYVRDPLTPHPFFWHPAPVMEAGGVVKFSEFEMSRLERLLEHPVLEGVAPRSLWPILSEVRWCRADPGAIISWPSSGHCYLVIAGRLHSYALLPDGRRLLFEIITAGGIGGLLNLVPGCEGNFAEAISPTLVVILTKRVVRRIVDCEPCVATNLLKLLLLRLQRRQEQLKTATHHDATRKVAQLLLDLSKTCGAATPDCTRPPVVELRPRPTHQEMADMLGLRRETVTLQMRKLRTAAAVRITHGRLLLDHLALRRIADSDPTASGHVRLQVGGP